MKDHLSYVQTPEFDQEVAKLQTQSAEENRAMGHAAHAQARSAYSALALMGQADVTAMSGETRQVFTKEVFALACYAFAGQPLILHTLAEALGCSQLDAMPLAVRAFGLLWRIDPEPLIRRMLGAQPEESKI